MLEVKNLSKRYGEKQALRSVSFSIQGREAVGFLGINGAGKTTTMNILTGYISASDGDEPTQSVGKNFIRSYAGVCLEGAIIALACIIFSVFAASPPAVGDTSLSAVTIVWNYIGELVFNLLVLVGAVKASDRIVKEIMGL